MASLEDASKTDFYYAFPFLDTFTITLTVRDIALREDSETKTYVIDKCPECGTGFGGGAPSGPAMAEKYADQPGSVKVRRIKAVDIDSCDIKIKAMKVDAIDFDDAVFHIKAKPKK